MGLDLISNIEEFMKTLNKRIADKSKGELNSFRYYASEGDIDLWTNDNGLLVTSDGEYASMFLATYIPLGEDKELPQEVIQNILRENWIKGQLSMTIFLAEMLGLEEFEVTGLSSILFERNLSGENPVEIAKAGKSIKLTDSAGMLILTVSNVDKSTDKWYNDSTEMEEVGNE